MVRSGEAVTGEPASRLPPQRGPGFSGSRSPAGRWTITPAGPAARERRCHRDPRRQATSDELYALFTEQQPAESPEGQWDLGRPDFPRGPAGGKDPTVDFILLTGLHVAASPVAWGRPISQRVLDELGMQLDRSALPGFLLGLTRFGSGYTDHFHPEGLNRSHTANLVWRLLPGDLVPFEMMLHIEVPGHYGLMHVGELQLTLQVVSRLTAWLNADMSAQPPPPEGTRRRLESLNGQPCSTR